MQGVARRTPRACEHCRQLRRRCEPPYPCRQCVAAGVSCHVRAKARPQRRQLRKGSRGGDYLGGPLSTSENQLPVIDRQSHDTDARSDARSPTDTFELLKALIREKLFEQHALAFDCTLTEPSTDKLGGPGSSVCVSAPSKEGSPSPLTSARVWDLFTTFRKFMGWQDAKLVNIEDLHSTACTHLEHLSNLSPSSVSKTLASSRLPIDSVALSFAALAIGVVANGEFENANFYFNISIEVVKHFVGPSTFDLCLAYFLQHFFAVRIGTSNYAQGIIAHAVRNAHDLGLDQNTCGTRGLQLYLLIYMADQYCSLTHNTEPIIQSSKVRNQIFAPLSQAEPQLKPLIDLITINGYIIEHSRRLEGSSPPDLDDLESKIGSLCSQLVLPAPERPACGGFRTTYEPLARVHMLCCRLKLRVPGLSDHASWLPSLCICVHSAEGVLTTYLQLYRPILTALLERNEARKLGKSNSSRPVAGKLPTTWRQVKRIMIAAFVVVIAYWHGEMIKEEASRYIAMARLLLEYPRWRWGENLDEALDTLVEISQWCGFELRGQMEKLLPGAGEGFLAPSSFNSRVEQSPAEATNGLPANQSVTNSDVLDETEDWPSFFETAPSNDMFGFVQDQTLFGLLEPSDFPG